MGSIIRAVIVYIVVLWVLITKHLYKTILEMNKIDHLLSAGNDLILTTDSNKWAEASNFAYVGDFIMQLSHVRMRTSVWQHRFEPTYLAYTFSQAKKGNTAHCTDFVTYFENDYSLETCSNRSGNLFPSNPATYRQTFTSPTLNELFQKHQEGVAYLKSQGGLHPGTLNKPVQDYILADIHATANYVRSLFLWPLRGVYWHFVRRHLWHGLSVQQQHEKRKIRLPSEMIQKTELLRF